METIIGNTVAAALDNLELNYTRDGERFTFTMCEEDANFRIGINCRRKVRAASYHRVFSGENLQDEP